MRVRAPRTMARTSSCSSRGHLVVGLGEPDGTTSRAPSNAAAYSAWWMLRRLVFERGSKTAQSRRVG